MTSLAGNMLLGQQFVISRVPVRRRGLRIPLWQIVPPVMLFFALLLQLGIRVILVEKGYRLETLRQEALAKDSELRGIRASLAQRTRPSDLAEKAQQQLGMSVLSADRVRRASAQPLSINSLTTAPINQMSSPSRTVR